MKRYYLPHDGFLLKNLYKRIVKGYRPLPSFPEVVQIQTITGCNARCVFCPNSILYDKLPKGTMEWDLFRKIIDEICKYNVKRISPYLMNEPLLDRDLPRKIKYIAENKRKDTIIKINTNGSLLDDEMAEALIESGLDRINFSVHGITKRTYESQMVGLNLEKVLENIDMFLSIKKKKGASKPRVRVTMVRTREVEKEIDYIKKYWESRGVKVNIRKLENRAKKEIVMRGINSVEWKPFSICDRMFRQAYITFDGKVVLCCVDWERTTVLGDLNVHTLKDVWNSQYYMELRRKFLKGDLSNMLCSKCLMS